MLFGVSLIIASPAEAAEKINDPGGKAGLLVQYRDDAVILENSDDSGSSRVRGLRRQHLGQKVELLQLAAGIDKEEYIARLKKDKRVKYVEENKRIKLCSVPNDNYYNLQWALPEIKAEAAWEKAGNGSEQVLIAVLDSGVDVYHPDLKNRLDSRGYNFVNQNSDISDPIGHGTAVSSLIAAETNNGLGIAGAGGQADFRILALKTADQDGYSYLSDIVAAINYAIEQGAEVINLSMGSSNYFDIENEAIQRAISQGITVVASAGNEGSSTYDYPASYPGVISVGAIDQQGEVASFSNYNDRVDLVAPGVDLLSCAPGNRYDYEQGTSFSAPLVTATAALLKAMDPTLTPAAIGNYICSSASDAGVAGRDDSYGHGVLNMEQAVVMAAPVALLTVQLKPAETTLNLGDCLQLETVCEPMNASNCTLVWSSDNEAVTVVNDQGKVRAVGVGQCRIIASTEDGSITSSCMVNVENDSGAGGFIIWQPALDVESNHQWTISFNRAVDPGSIDEDSVYITDRQGNIKPSTCMVDSERDGSVIKVSPGDTYDAGQQYTLWVRDLRDKNARLLGHGVKMDFTIESK